MAFLAANHVRIVGLCKSVKNARIARTSLRWHSFLVCSYERKLQGNCTWSTERCY